MEGGAPAPPPAPPAKYSVKCTWKQFAAVVVDLIKRGLLQPHGSDGDCDNSFPTCAVERELRRLCCRQSGALSCALCRLLEPGEGFVMPPEFVSLFCCDSGRYGVGTALEMAHFSMEEKAAVLKRCIAAGWLDADSLVAAVTVASLSGGGAVNSRWALLETLAYAWPFSSVANRVDEGNGATRYAILKAAAEKQRADAIVAGGVEQPLAYGSCIVRDMDAMKHSQPCSRPGCMYAAQVVDTAEFLLEMFEAEAETGGNGVSNTPPSSQPNVVLYENDSPEAPAIAAEMQAFLADIGDALPESAESLGLVGAASTTPPGIADHAFSSLPSQAAAMSPATAAALQHLSSLPPMVFGELGDARLLRSARTQRVPHAAQLLPSVAAFSAEDAKAELLAEASPYYTSAERGEELGLLPPTTGWSAKVRGEQPPPPPTHYRKASSLRGAIAQAPYKNDPSDPRYPLALEEYALNLATRIPGCADCVHDEFYQWYREVPELERFDVLSLLKQMAPDGWLPGEREDGQARLEAAYVRWSESFDEQREVTGCACTRMNGGKTFARWGACCHCQKQPPEEYCAYCRRRNDPGFKAGGRATCNMRTGQRAAAAAAAAD